MRALHVGTRQLEIQSQDGQLETTATPPLPFAAATAPWTFGQRCTSSIEQSILPIWPANDFESVCSSEGAATAGDWYKFDAQEGEIFTIDVFGIDEPADAIVRLYAPSEKTFFSTHVGLAGYEFVDTSCYGLGHWMMESDGDSGFAEGGAGFTLNVPVSGMYYLHVSPHTYSPTWHRPYALSFYRAYAQACCYPPFP